MEPVPVPEAKAEETKASGPKAEEASVAKPKADRNIVRFFWRFDGGRIQAREKAKVCREGEGEKGGGWRAKCGIWTRG